MYYFHIHYNFNVLNNIMKYYIFLGEQNNNVNIFPESHNMSNFIIKMINIISLIAVF
jgi:hypothetical protein